MTRWGLLAAAAALARTAAAQVGTTSAGAVLLVRPSDTIPLAGARVVLHRVGLTTQGPIDSVQADAAGRFRFRFRADTAATYLLSTRHADIEYFSTPLATPPAPADPGLRVLVFDTSSAVPTRTARRLLVVSAPDAMGARTVVDWFVIRNASPATRVGRGAAGLTWAAALPAGVSSPSLGDPRVSQFSPDAVSFSGDSVAVSAPIAPGDKEIVIQYEIPAGRRALALPLDGVDSVEVFTEEEGVRFPTGWRAVQPERFMGRTFRRFIRTDPLAGRATIRFPGGPVAPAWPLGVLVAVFAVALVAATVRSLSRRPSAALAARRRDP